jgi:GTP:adenosylcobinamide-phosphate guanylyltransferase
MTVPVDVSSGLFPDAYAAGARVHINSWGCKVLDGEDRSYCGNYTTQVHECQKKYHSIIDNLPCLQASDIDNFVWNNRDFVVITAAGDNGRTAAASTVYRCKLYCKL